MLGAELLEKFGLGGFKEGTEGLREVIVKVEMCEEWLLVVGGAGTV